MDMHTHLFAAFVLAATIICVTPGPDMLYIMSCGMSQGRSGGLSAAVGMAAGMLIHALLTAFGVALIISRYPALLAAFKVFGVCYLLYLGVNAIRNRSRMSVHAERSRDACTRIARKAMVVNLTNPAVIVFFAAFLPQFTTDSGWPAPVQLLMLGVTFVAIGFVTDATVGLASGALSRRISADKGLARKVNVGCGSVMFLLAALLAIEI